MLNNLRKFIIDYSLVVLLTIFLNLLIRIGEYWYISVIKYENVNLILFFSKSINFDSLFIVLFSLAILIPLLLIAIFKLELAKIISRIIFYLLILFLFILTEYFLINNALLSSSVFDYTLSEIFNILFIELSMNRIDFIIALIFLLIISALLFAKSHKLSSFKFVRWSAIIYLLLGLISFTNRNHTFKTLPYFDSYNHFLLGNSKPIFFIKTYLDNLELAAFSTQQEIKEEVIKFQSFFPKKDFQSLDYPLLNNQEYDNVLGDFFNSSDKKPNIVIIISESLSATFSGNNLSIKKSLTPFTDSIASVGLSWNNFFSNAERSYGVLPNLLASLPFGTANNGFINMDKGATGNLRYPKHNSLFKLLNKNGYRTSYFYGGAGNFDNVFEFIHQNEVNNCITLEHFDTTKYFKNLYAGENESWGYKDGDLYNQGLDVMDTIKSPYLSVFQTLSNHSPFNLADEKYYTEEYLKIKLDSLGLSKEDIKSIDQNILSSIFYADDALKAFFEGIKKRKDYKNTIFIITGDHAMDLNLADHVFENYHIPFIIYSPLLSKTAEFNSVSSHIDVLPSLLALLKNNYQLKVSKENHWLGEGLTVNSNFESNQFISLNIKALDMPSVIIKDKILFAGDIYQFNQNLGITRINDTLEIKDFMTQFENYKKINYHVCKNNLIEE